jgi:hypothetical protein
MDSLPGGVADRIYTLLVAYAGASESRRKEFVTAHTDEALSTYTFHSILGFTGYFRREPQSWFVEIGREPVSEFRLWCISEANKHIEALYKKHKEKKHEAPLQ